MKPGRKRKQHDKEANFIICIALQVHTTYVKKIGELSTRSPIKRKLLKGSYLKGQYREIFVFDFPGSYRHE
jgi:hypothetical protein